MVQRGIIGFYGYDLLLIVYEAVSCTRGGSKGGHGTMALIHQRFFSKVRFFVSFQMFLDSIIDLINLNTLMAVML